MGRKIQKRRSQNMSSERRHASGRFTALGRGPKPGARLFGMGCWAGCAISRNYQSPVPRIRACSNDNGGSPSLPYPSYLSSSVLRGELQERERGANIESSGFVRNCASIINLGSRKGGRHGSAWSALDETVTQSEGEPQRLAFVKIGDVGPARVNRARKPG